jgi:hypothetical protein
LFTLYVNNGEWINSVSTIPWARQSRPSQNSWAKSDPFQKNSINFQKKIVIVPRIFLSILINISLYFYTVKIKIQY